MMLLRWYLLTAVGMWLPCGTNGNFFVGILNDVVYIELVGMPDSSGAGYQLFGVLVTTKDKDYRLAYGKKLTLSRRNEISQQWKVLYGRPTVARDVNHYGDIAQKLGSIKDPNEAIFTFNDFPGVKQDSSAVVTPTADLLRVYYDTSNLKTSQSCTDLNLDRDQFFRTDFWNVSQISNAEVTIKYIVEGCPGKNTSCVRDLRLYSISLDEFPPDDYYFFPDNDKTTKQVKQLNVNTIGTTETAAVSFDLRENRMMAIGLWAQGLCLHVTQLLFTIKRCQAYEQNLAKYAAVLVPFNGSVSYNGTCVNNSEPQGVDGLKWSCSASGDATYGKGCVCAKGYQKQNDGCVAVQVDETAIVKTGKSPLIMIILLSTLIPLVVFILAMAWQRHRAKKHQNGPPVKKRKKTRSSFWGRSLRNGTGHLLQGAAEDGFVAPVYQNIDEYEFLRSNLTFISQLGDGQFGSVHLAQATNISGWIGKSNVAVKVLKESAGAECESDFLAEIDLLRQLGHHENVVRLLGCCTHNGPAWIIFEYMENGDLRTFVRKHSVQGNNGSKASTLPLDHLLDFALGIANGMKFVGEKGIVHRDLAARNILLDHNNVCKVTDFGLARYLDEDGYYFKGLARDGKLPVKWMALECMQEEHKYQCTVKSDVWSFGVVLWEIFACGEEPYGDDDWRDVRRFLTDGHRMESPKKCPSEMYQVMLGCWAEDPDARPSFAKLVELFSQADIWSGAVTTFGACKLDM